MGKSATIFIPAGFCSDYSEKNIRAIISLEGIIFRWLFFLNVMVKVIIRNFYFFLIFLNRKSIFNIHRVKIYIFRTTYKKGSSMKWMRYIGQAGIFVLSLGLVFLPQMVYSQEDQGYVSSKGCGMCHKPVKVLWDIHSHSRMLRPVQGGTAPEGTDVSLPDGMTWADIT